MKESRRRKLIASLSPEGLKVLVLSLVINGKLGAAREAGKIWHEANDAA